MMSRLDIRHVSYLAAATVMLVAVVGPRPSTAQTHYESIGWTPDGRALTVSAAEDIHRLPLEGGPAERLTATGSRDVHASWAPDGSALAFGSYRDGDAEIFVASSDGSGARALTDDDADDGAPAWSPDGREIAFMKETGEHWQIWIMAADGSDPRRLTRSDGNDWNPRWSPDGRWIVFESSRHEGDQDEIYRIRPDGTGERRLTDTPGNDIYPDWSPDGERIAYCTIEDGRAFVYTIPAAGGEPELLLEDACHPAWSPDGSRLAYVSVSRGDRRRLFVAEPDGSGATEVAGLDARPVVDATEAAHGSTSGAEPEAASGSGSADPDAAPAAAHTPSTNASRKPRVAILVYDGVQIIDHAAPWEVLGQYSLNEVFTVAKDTTPITTWMGMRVIPSYGFGDHPEPDVVVIPGGDAREVVNDPEVIDWIGGHAPESRYVLGVCAGVMLLAEADLLDGRRATTYYDLLDDLAEERPAIDVIDDRLVVEDGKFITTTGTGIEGALRVMELLHGKPWARVVSLNLEFEPLPEGERTPRPHLADMNLPSSIYGAFPWREAELTLYEGDTEHWQMAWRLDRDDVGDLPALAATLAEGLEGEGWELDAETLGDDAWTSTWRLRGRAGDAWRGDVGVRHASDGRLVLRLEVDEGRARGERGE
ncbi:MAG: DJ-1/PfpI family protein [Gemmatimonadota bacterium]